MSQNIHFVKVQANDCEDAIYEAQLGMNIENTEVDYFNVVGAFNLENPSDFFSADLELFNALLGNNPDDFIKQVINNLNDYVRPIELVKQELINKVTMVNIENVEKGIARQVKELANELAGCFYVTDIIEHSKYNEVWHEVGLTNLYGSQDDRTHLVLVRFHC